jgi:hypothetical protein
MSPEIKFAVEPPSRARLDELGALVDAVEAALHRGADHAPALAALNAQLTCPVTAEEVALYYEGCTRDELVEEHLTPDPYGFRGLTDHELLWLIGRLLDPELRQATRSFYGAIVDANVMLPAGTTVCTGFNSERPEPAAILAQLRARRSTTICL